MKKHSKHILLCLLMLLFLMGMGGWLLVKSPDSYSLSERRILVTKTEFTLENVVNGKFMTKVEDYALAQFPLRDVFRSIKAVWEHFVFQKKDNNGIYLQEGYLSKMEYPLNEPMLNQSLERIAKIYRQYLEDQGITPYLVIIPDKNYYLADKHGMLTLDYEALYDTLLSQTDYMNYIEIRDFLELEDYYKTDTHWKQECLLDVAAGIGKAMGHPLQAEYERVSLNTPFYGVYAGQAAIPVASDVLTYLTNEVLDKCIVTGYDTGEPVRMLVYDQSKVAGKDPYEMFLAGSQAVLTVENKEATSNKELVIFRDSFGSSLTPLLVEEYQKITLIDLRYIRSDMVGSYVDFKNQDVLFMYSTLLLNHGLGGGN